NSFAHLGSDSYGHASFLCPLWIFVTRKASLQCRSSRRGCALPKEVHQVKENRLASKLPQQGSDLATMIGSMIYNVQHRLPERILVHAEFERLVFHLAGEVRLSHSRDKRLNPPLQLSPCFPQALDIGKLIHVR